MSGRTSKKLTRNPNSPFLPHGGYENLRSYVVAEAVYDATVVFCNRFIEKSSRTHDQMIQASRSGVRNISEGSGAAATSRKMEMKLSTAQRGPTRWGLPRRLRVGTGCVPSDLFPGEDGGTV